MEPAKTTFRRYEGLVPDPKLRLREQLRQVMRFKQFSSRTDEAYWNWIKQFILFHGKKHPREMGKLNDWGMAMGRAFSPHECLWFETWGVAPGWDGGAPLALAECTPSTMASGVLETAAFIFLFMPVGKSPGEANCEAN